MGLPDTFHNSENTMPKAQSQYKPIGQYRFPAMGGPTVTYGQKPYYGRRMQYLPAVRTTMLQVQVMVLGSLMWINVRPEDLK